LPTTMSILILFGHEETRCVSNGAGCSSTLRAAGCVVSGGLRLPEGRSAGHPGAVLDTLGVVDQPGDEAVEGGDDLGVAGVVAGLDDAALTSREGRSCLHGEAFVVLVDDHDLVDVAGRERARVLRDGQLCADHLERVGRLVVVGHGGLEFERERARTHGDDVTLLDVLALEHESLEQGIPLPCKVRVSDARTRPGRVVIGILP